MKKKLELEKHIEARFLRELRKRWSIAEARKMNGFGNRSWPDRLIILPNGASFYIEFKRPGGELSPGQAQKIKELKALKQRVYVFDNAEDAIEQCELESYNVRR